MDSMWLLARHSTMSILVRTSNFDKKDSFRRTPPAVFLVSGLCLGTRCSRGFASRRTVSETHSAGGACKTVGSKAEPWSQSQCHVEPVPGAGREVSKKIFNVALRDGTTLTLSYV